MKKHWRFFRRLQMKKKHWKKFWNCKQKSNLDYNQIFYERNSFILKEIEDLEGLRLRSTSQCIDDYVEFGYIKEYRLRDYPSYTEHKRSKRQGHKQGRSEDSADNTGRKRSTGENSETVT